METTTRQYDHRAGKALAQHQAEIARKAEQGWATRLRETINKSVMSAIGIHATTDSRNREAFITGMQRRGAPVYAGTVSPQVIAKRRARNKMARMSRRVNRG